MRRQVSIINLIIAMGLGLLMNWPILAASATAVTRTKVSIAFTPANQYTGDQIDPPIPDGQQAYRETTRRMPAVTPKTMADRLMRGHLPQTGDWSPEWASILGGLSLIILVLAAFVWQQLRAGGDQACGNGKR